MKRNHDIGVSSRFVEVSLNMILGLTVAFVSIIGITLVGFYDQETLTWRVQATGQDYVDLFLIVPVLLLSGWYAMRGRFASEFVWLGTLLYCIYTFVIYCFDVHFNSLFLFYCVALGLSFYLLLFRVLRYRNYSLKASASPGLIRLTAGYLIVIGVLFIGLWLSALLPAIIHGSVPVALAVTGLPTNPVHVIDLAIVLPGLILCGVFLLRGSQAAKVVAPALLTFFILMDITITVLSLMMKANGLEGDPIVALIMSLLAVFSMVLLFLHLRMPASSAQGQSH